MDSVEQKHKQAQAHTSAMVMKQRKNDNALLSTPKQVMPESSNTTETETSSVSGAELQQEWPMVEPLDVESDDELHPQWR